MKRRCNSSSFTMSFDRREEEHCPAILSEKVNSNSAVYVVLPSEQNIKSDI